eukprot:CAMPEP_0175074156 /NCGR_PEP_ID=MMETSP0052_2-20121109/21106_1 /TAXON_ID=51329 ORGANISM="Polytomella parva, Strain SAG 63-3" /NCGR_SAMPLE_ID=MMETSP0052_2 /ASSEMBLY_ACC=CAM_ASM_000194 /LENGTH=171 /DNA_ID=CAMNT_0016342335 /DNA_START=569 /DNA_END=1084 /DNA_ORIENTATION=-
MVEPDLIDKENKLVLERITKGKLNNYLHKSLLLSDTIVDWKWPHRPETFVKEYNDILSPLVMPFHPTYRDIKLKRVENTTVQAFVHAFFINHYQIRSFTEYLCGRALRLKSAGGSDNIWGIAPLVIFTDHNRDHEGEPVSKDFTSKMALRVKERLKSLRLKYPYYWQFLQG